MEEALVVEKKGYWEVHSGVLRFEHVHKVITVFADAGADRPA